MLDELLKMIQPNEAEAAMLPDVRKAYNAARQALRAAGKADKPLYHWSTDTEKLLAAPTIHNRDIAANAENFEHQPLGIYASENLQDNATTLSGEGFSPREHYKNMISGAGANEGFVRILPKAEATEKTISEDDLIARFERGLNPNTVTRADILKVLDAEGGAVQSEHIIRNPKKVSMFSDKKAWLPSVASLAAGGVMSATPSDSEAAMPPQIRQMYNLAREAAQKTLYHHSYTPEQLMEKGVDPAKFTSGMESYKPKGLYWAESPVNIPGHLSGSWPANNAATLTRLKQHQTGSFERRGATSIIRGTVSPEAQIFTIPEQQLRDEYGKFRSMMRLNQPQGSTADDFDSMVKDAWTKELTKRGDVLHIPDADAHLYADGTGFPGKPEYIALHPDFMNMFYENLARTPSTGKTKIYSDERDQAAAKKYVDKMLGPLPSLQAGLDSGMASDAFGEYIAPTDTVASKSKDLADSAEKWYQESSQLLSDLKAGGSGLAKLGIPVGLATSILLGDQDAEASPLGKLSKESLKDTIRSTSLPRNESALDRMLGKTLNLHFGDSAERTPHEVVDIRRHGPDSHMVIVKDAQGNRSQLPMTNDYLNAMLGAQGTKDYVEQFAGQGLQGKKIQSLKSLGIREAKKDSGAIKNDNLFRDFNSMQKAKASEIDPALANDYVYVKNQQNETLYMPKTYADFLAKKGHVKILKR